MVEQLAMWPQSGDMLTGLCQPWPGQSRRDHETRNSGLWALIAQRVLKSGCYHLAFGIPERVASLWPGGHLCHTEKNRCSDLRVWITRVKLPAVFCF